MSRNPCPPRSGCGLVARAAILLLAVRSVPCEATEAYGWFDEVRTSRPRWSPPNEALTGISSEPADYTSLTLWVRESGTYRLTSNQTFDGMLVLYEGGFDPQHPLANAIAANDDDGSPLNSSLEVRLAAGLLYIVVTTAKSTTDGGMVNSRIEGPGTIRPSTCFIGDEIHVFDDNSALALNDSRFCVYAEWHDFAGNSGSARPVGYRSDDSGQLWFFRPANWEMQVKVLDGCAINGHYWVFLSATTNVGFTLTVDDLFLVHPSRSYTNVLGETARTVTDTTAFPCD